jgi:hypothetical protein
MIRIKIYFGNLTDILLHSRGAVVLVSLSGNIYYTGTVISGLLTTLQEKHDIFGGTITNAANGGKVQVAAKRAARIEYIVALKAVAAFCNFTTPNNEVALRTSGFELTSGNRTPVTMEPIKKVTVVNAMDRGSVIAKVFAGSGTKQVRIEFAIGDTLPADGDWRNCAETKRTCTISGLTSGQKVWIRATAVGTNSQKMTAEPVCVIIL